MEDVVVAREVRQSFGASGGCRRRDRDGAVEVLHGISLAVQPGEMVSIVGPSGSGKSTLLHCLAGLEALTSGEVELAGFALAGLSRGRVAAVRARHVGFVFQQYNLVVSLSVAENVGLPARLAGRRLDASRVSEALTRVGLAGFERRRPAELSGGEQQRVAVARALAAEPDVVFADEPTGALDSASGAAVLGVLCDAADGRRSVVMVTHDLEAAARADRVLVLRDGRIERELWGVSAAEILEAMEDARRCAWPLRSSETT